MRPQLNPFYIEQKNGTEETWEGDWKNDEGDVEEEGLLEQHQQYRNSGRGGESATRRRQRLLHHLPTQPFPMVRPRHCFAFVAVLVVLLVLLSFTEDVAERPAAHDGGARIADKPHPINSTAVRADINSTTVRADIVILGERNSGVDWLRDRLKECYPEITVRTRLSRDAWMFQEKPPNSKSNQEKDDTDALPILLVTIVRDPYDWIRQMHKHPLYMPAHTHISLKRFVNTPWTAVAVEPPAGDNTTTARNNATATDTSTKKNKEGTTTPCQLGFRENQVVPCHVFQNETLKKNTPIYELSKDGTPFSNIAKLRAAKIVHWTAQVPTMYKDYLLWMPGQPIVVHYESPLFAVLKEIETTTHWQRKCQEDSTAPNQTLGAPPPFYEKWVNETVEWSVEATIGYEPHSG
jgi:hypothetical protein